MKTSGLPQKPAAMNPTVASSSSPFVITKIAMRKKIQELSLQRNHTLYSCQILPVAIFLVISIRGAILEASSLQYTWIVTNLFHIPSIVSG